MPTDGTPGLLDAALPIPETGHESARLTALTSFLGAPFVGKAPDFPLRQRDRREAAELLQGVPYPWIGVHPSTWDAIKQWPVNRFVEAAQEIRRRAGGTVVILGGGTESGGLDSGAVKQLVDGLAGSSVDLTGRTSLGSLGAIIDRLSLLLTNDSGPAHIAYALGAPSVTVFGGTDPSRWGPPSPGPHRALAFEVACRPCELPACPVGEPMLVRDIRRRRRGCRAPGDAPRGGPDARDCSSQDRGSEIGMTVRGRRVSGVRKIAILRANGLGDLMFALPALDAMRATYPGAEIVLLGREWHVAFFLNRPGPVDRVIAVPPCRGITEANNYPREPAVSQFLL